MRLYIVMVMFISLMSGKIKLTKEQYDKRSHALQKTDDEGVYEITGTIGFKRGEKFSYEGDTAQLLKSGMIDYADDSEDADEDSGKEDATMSEILKDLRSQKGKQLQSLAKSLSISTFAKNRNVLIKEISDRIYADKKFDQIVESLEALSDDELVAKAGEVGVLPGDLNRDDLIFAIAEKMSEEVK